MPKRKKNSLLIPTLIMGTVAVILVVIVYSRGNGELVGGMRGAGLLMLQILPLLAFSLIVSSMVQVLVPKEVISRVIGAESGLRGIVVSALVGGLTPGGPFVNLPIALALQRAGADVGVMVSFITGWSLYAVSRFPLEIGILGWRFTLIRLTCILLLPPLAGLLARLLFSHVKL